MHLLTLYVSEHLGIECMFLWIVADEAEEMGLFDDVDTANSLDRLLGGYPLAAPNSANLLFNSLVSTCVLLAVCPGVCQYVYLSTMMCLCVLKIIFKLLLKIYSWRQVWNFYFLKCSATCNMSHICNKFLVIVIIIIIIKVM